MVVVPGLVLAEVDYFLRENRVAMRKLVAEIFDPATRYEYELPLPSDIVRALELEARFSELGLVLVDGTVVAVAERRRIYRVLTPDRRDFALRACRAASHTRSRAPAMTSGEAAPS